MRRKRKEKILDYLEGRTPLEGEGAEKEQQGFGSLQKILKNEEVFQPPPGFWESYLPNLRRRMEKKGERHSLFAPALASALSLLIIAFLLFRSQIFLPGLLSSLPERGYWNKDLAEVTSVAELERIFSSLAQAFGLSSLAGSLEDLKEGKLDLENLEEKERKRLLGALGYQIEDEIGLASDLLYWGRDIEEITKELSSDELKELENQLNRL